MPETKADWAKMFEEWMAETRWCEAERLWRPIADNRCSESNYCYRMENASDVDWKLGLTPLEELPNVERCAPQRVSSLHSLSRLCCLPCD